MNSYTSDNALINHKEECGDDDICTITTSSESHIQWNKRFHTNHFFFKIYVDFEADNEIDNSTRVYETTNVYEQNQVLIGYYIKSEFEHVLKSELEDVFKDILL